MGFGDRLKQARLAKGLTRDELGTMAGVSRSAISNYENEISHPKESVIYRLFKALDVDANFLFQDEIDIKKTPPAEAGGDKEFVLTALDSLPEEGRKEASEYIRYLLSKYEVPSK